MSDLDLKFPPGLRAKTVDSQVIVYIPTTQSYLQLSPGLWKVAEQLTGQGAAVDLDSPVVAHAAQVLKEAGILVARSAHVAESAPPPEGYLDPLRKQSLLFCHLGASPGPAIENLYSKLRLDLLWSAVGRWSLTVLFGAMTIDLLLNSAGLFDLFASARLGTSDWLFFFGVLPLRVVTHELSHAVACTHYGGRVRAMGLGLYYGLPVAYTDVSDAWFFERRREKLIVHGVGIAVDLYLATLAAVLLLHGPETLRSTAAVFIYSTLVSTIWNLNPLTMSDGYFLLADVLRAPNLRIRAIESIVGRFKPSHEVSPAILIYGLAALAYVLVVSWSLGKALMLLVRSLTGLELPKGSLVASLLVACLIVSSLRRQVR